MNSTSLSGTYPNSPLSRLGSILLCLCAVAGAANAAPAKDNSPCPDLSGHYRVADFGDARGDALEAMRISMAGFADSEVRFARGSGQNWDLFIRSGSSSPLSTHPTTTLEHGRDFACRDGWVELLTPVRSSRKTEQDWFEGQTVLRLNKASPNGLTLAARFSGGKRSTLFQYDSARLSLPIPGTGIRLNESIHWPDISEPAPPRTVATEPAPEAYSVVQTRKRLTSSLLGPVLLAGLNPAAQGVSAILRANKSTEVAALEKRLHDAGIGYQVVRQPVWSDRTYYLELLILAAGSTAAWRPSLMWVDEELRRTRYPGSEPGPVQSDPQGYRITMMLSGNAQAQDVATRIHTLSGAFAEVRVLPPPEVTLALPAGMRSASLLLLMK